MRPATIVDVSVSPRGAARIRTGNPWVFRPDLVRPAPVDADCVRVVDDRGRVLGHALWAPEPSALALRLYARGPEAVSFDDVLERRLEGAALRRAAFLPGAVAVRLVHAEADGLPGLFVDRYADAAVVQAATGAIDRREEGIARLLVERFGVRVVVRRDDGSARDAEGLPRLKGVLRGDGPTRVRVREGEATFEIDLLEDAKTGAFLDQRENHLRVGAIARGDALDVFSYQGGFALAMAARAERVLAIEEDPRAAERARANAALSGVADRVEVRQADAFVALRELEAAGRRFDTIVLDPPALAKRKGPLQTALRAYHELNVRALRMAKPGGVLVSCSCSGKVTAELFGEMLVKAAADARRSAAIVERRGAGADHPVLLGVPETDYLKCWILAVD